MKLNLKWKITLGVLAYGITQLIIAAVLIALEDSSSLKLSVTETVSFLIAPSVIIWAVLYGAISTRKLVDIRPILGMIDAAEKVKKGDLNTKVNEEGTDEIADLAKAFNQMIKDIRKMVGDMGEKIASGGIDEPHKNAGNARLKTNYIIVLLAYGLLMLMIGFYLMENDVMSAIPAMEGLNTTVTTLIMMPPIMIPGALLFGFYFSKKLIDVRPIAEMAGAARKISAGDLTVSVSEEGTDEIADLAKAFNQMILSVRLIAGDTGNGQESTVKEIEGLR